MEQLAIQMDRIRDELCRLLDMYDEADRPQQRAIARRCEELGGQVQDLVGMLKFSLLELRKEAQEIGGGSNDQAEEVEQVTNLGLQTIHAAGQEVAQAIRCLRNVWDEEADADAEY
ncbi:MAG: hypothetical protein JSV19_09715 [Phycisphaerales bacterium]|nr:MAG: hypothetical protein JSV19_09715 [Phycisphaerales bacterium]